MLVTVVMIVLVFCMFFRNAELVNETFVSNPNFYWLRNSFHIASIIFKTISKFRVKSPQERDGLLNYCLMFWDLMGEASIAINIKKKGDKVNYKFYYHLCHAGGMPFKDLTFNLPWFILVNNGFAGGALDEKMNEGCYAFQVLPLLRQLLKKRTPFHELYEMINLRPILYKTAKSFHWKGSTYVDDIRFDMRDLAIDSSMFVLSDRLGGGILKLIDLLVEHYKQEDDNVNPLDWYQFYDDGSVKVECDMLFAEKGIRQPPIVLSQSLHGWALGASVCDYGTWKPIVEKLIKQAIEKSPHCTVR